MYKYIYVCIYIYIFLMWLVCAIASEGALLEARRILFIVSRFRVIFADLRNDDRYCWQRNNLRQVFELSSRFSQCLPLACLSRSNSVRRAFSGSSAQSYRTFFNEIDPTKHRDSVVTLGENNSSDDYDREIRKATFVATSFYRDR